MSTAMGTSARTVAMGHVRFTIVAMLFAVTAVNYADRATLSIAGPALSKALHLSPVQMGFVFSAFGWSYVICQVPGGWLLDRFGSKWVYFGSISLWSVFTLFQGSVGLLGVATAVYALFALRLIVGAAKSPSFPANARIVAAWFPANERGTASAIFNSAQYFATVLFAPIMGWLTSSYGWPYPFYFMGALGLLVSLVWLKTVYSPREHPRLGPAELDYLERGGALVNMDEPEPPAATIAARPAGVSEHVPPQGLAPEPDDAGHLPRAILHQRDHLLLHHLVPGLPGPAAAACRS